MNKQGPNGIDWTDYTWNPVTGCRHGCEWCYARRMAERFRLSFLPQFHENRLIEPSKLTKPAKIFVCSMADLFGGWIDSDRIEAIIQVAQCHPHHTFQFLTKNPKRYAEFIFPDNCWIGATAIDSKAANDALHALENVDARVKFLSCEPLLGDMNGLDLTPIDWLIIGALTGSGAKSPDAEWVQNLMQAAVKAKLPVWMKDSLDFTWLLKQWPYFATDG